MRVVGKTEALFGDAEEVAVELVVAVFVVDDGDGVSSRSNVIEGERGVVAVNEKAGVLVGLVVVLWPAIGRVEQSAADVALRVAQSCYVDDDGAATSLRLCRCVVLLCMRGNIWGQEQGSEKN